MSLFALQVYTNSQQGNGISLNSDQRFQPHQQVTGHRHGKPVISGQLTEL